MPSDAPDANTPRNFDVMVTENLFGDILTDEAAVLAGSLGMLPSGTIGVQLNLLYEPVHGSAPPTSPWQRLRQPARRNPHRSNAASALSNLEADA